MQHPTCLHSIVRVVALATAAALTSGTAAAQTAVGEIESLQLIAEGSGGFPGTIDPGDAFGSAMGAIGDIDGDGIADVAVGVKGDDDGGTDRGAVWVLFMTQTGSVGAATKISDSNLGTRLTNNAGFGSAVEGLGDLDGDGTPDIVVGASGSGAGGNNTGAAWVLLMNSDGSVKSTVKIGENSGGFTGQLKTNDGFGRSIAVLGDVDGNGVVDLAVGADRDSVSDVAKGAVWILFLNGDGTVASHVKLTDTELGGVLDPKDRFGTAVAALSDSDGNGVPDLAVGAPGDDDGPGENNGAVYLLRLDAAANVLGVSKISATAGGFTGSLRNADAFGTGLSLLDDLDGNGTRDLAVGAPGDDVMLPGGITGSNRGALWVLFLEPDATVDSYVELNGLSTGLGPLLADGAAFGTSVTSADLDGDGFRDPLAGATGSSIGGAAIQMFLVTPGADGNQPYTGGIPTLAGRPGRATLVVFPPDGSLPPPPDFIGDPVIIVPTTDGGLVRAQSVDGSAGGGFSDEGSYPTQEDPAQADSGNFDAGAADFLGSNPLTALSDVVTANTGSDSVSVLTGNADGTFAPAVHTALAFDTQPVSVQVGDFNGDLLDDVAVAGAAGVTVMLGDGLSSFTTQTFTPVSDVTDLAVGFVDGDAFLDVVAASGTIAAGPGMESGFATVLLGNGDGSLTNAGSFAPGQAVASVLLGQLDPDGMIDALIVTHQYDGGPSGEPQGVIDLYLGDGAGGFTPSTNFQGFVTPDAGGIHPTYGGLADVNGDMLLDAVYTSTSSIAYPLDAFADQHPPVVLTVLTADGNGGFDVSTLGTAYSGKGVSAVLEDYSLPKDSMADVVLVWHEDDLAGTGAAQDQVQTFLALLKGNGAGTIFDDAASNQYATGDEPGDGAIGDIDGASADGSGTPDIIVPNRASNSLTVLLGNGDTTFTPAPDVTGVDDTVSPGRTWRGGPLVAQFGGDQVVDGTVFGFPIVTYNAWVDTGPNPDPTVLASLSAFTSVAGVLTKAQQLTLPRGGEFAQADLDGDLVTDFVVTQRLGAPTGSDAVHVYPGLGPSQAAVSTTPAVTPAPTGHRLTGGLHVQDFIGSSLPDVVTTSVDIATGQGHVVLYENSAGSLLPGVAWPLSATWSAIRNIDTGDLNGDGFVDIAIGEEDGRLFLAAGAAGGSFAPAPPTLLIGTLAGGAIALEKFTGDSLIDLVSANDLGATGLGQAYVRTARGTGTNLGALQTVAGLSSTDADGRALVPLIADLEGDGAVELVLIHGSSDSVSVFMNEFDTFENYGSSKPGAGGFTPQLGAIGYSVLGARPKLTVTQGLGGAPTLIQVGMGRTTNLFPAVEVVFKQILYPLSGPAGVPGAGSFILPTVLPNDPELIGFEFTVQVIVLDQFAGSPEPWDFSITKGLAFTLVE